MLYSINSVLFARKLLIVELFKLSLALVGIVNLMSNVLILLLLTKEHLLKVLSIPILLHLTRLIFYCSHVVLLDYFLL